MTAPRSPGDDASGPPGPRAWHAELAWLPGLGVRRDVLVEAVGDRFTGATPGVAAAGLPAGTTRLAGLTLPGLANAHSHAFHRALRGITQAGRGTFWTWRERMYEVAGRLDPDRYLSLARATYAEMALAGITCVGEFHYVHHDTGGAAYADPNEMGRALIEAAAQAGIRICLLDACYLSGGLGPGGDRLPLAGAQLRFGDGDAHAWVARVDALGADEHGMLGAQARAGAAIHSVRAVPPDQMGPIVAWARRLGAPLHAHLSEQQAENHACLAAYGQTPAEVLDEAGALGPRSTAVHATHLSATDIALLGDRRSYACFCPTTEADLADGIGPARALASAGSPLTVGSDSQAVIDLLEETRRVELGERLATWERGHFTAAELLRAATVDGHASLGWPEVGQIAPGALADLVTIALDTPRTAGTAPDTALESVIFGATAADVRAVVVGGREVVRDGQHLLVPDVPAALSAAIRAVLP
ncbi:MAG TPA: formimidoylglutamate deiminase [Streptosporangiaceae bacterium]|nr:formimidoylglutamate deiminase [Streptosporangiaceae bacterium]